MWERKQICNFFLGFLLIILVGTNFESLIPINTKTLRFVNGIAKNLPATSSITNFPLMDGCNKILICHQILQLTKVFP